MFARPLSEKTLSAGLACYPIVMYHRGMLVIVYIYTTLGLIDRIRYHDYVRDPGELGWLL